MRQVALVAGALILLTLSPRAEQAGPTRPEAFSLSGSPLVAPANLPNRQTLAADLQRIR